MQSSQQPHRAPRQALARPAQYARIAGALYLVIIVIGLFGEAFVRDRLVVSGDAAATAANLLASEGLWRASVSGELAYLTLAVVVGMLLYVLLRPVNRDVALLALLFTVVSIAVEAVGRLLLLAPLVLLRDASYLHAFEPQQRQALAYVFIRLHGYGFGLSLIFFGCACLANGFLLRRSAFLPVPIGWLLQVAGVCYLINSFALLLAPALAQQLFPVILLPPFVAESAFCLWLLFKGVDTAKWRDLSNAVAARGA
jgi:Domain of unknown function (DUF4386)